MVVVDYNVGNIGSIINMFKKVGVKAEFTSDKDKILKADKLLLPGVGHFDNGMRSLNESGLIEVLNHKVFDLKTPILGICLGMQLLLEGSEEGTEKGLGWIPGRVRKFDLKDKSLKVPHMGWNKVTPFIDHPLFKGLDSDMRFYFVHSYYADVQNENILGETFYGEDFTSCIHKENIMGVQFHPEKSHRFGMQLLKNFGEM